MLLYRVLVSPCPTYSSIFHLTRRVVLTPQVISPSTLLGRRPLTDRNHQSDHRPIATHSPWVSRHSGRPSNVPVSATHPILENMLIEFKIPATQPRPCGQTPMRHLTTSIPSTTLIITSLMVKPRVWEDSRHRHPASTVQSTPSNTNDQASGGRPHRMSSHQNPSRRTRPQSEGVSGNPNQRSQRRHRLSASRNQSLQAVATWKSRKPSVIATGAPSPRSSQNVSFRKAMQKMQTPRTSRRSDQVVD